MHGILRDYEVHYNDLVCTGISWLNRAPALGIRLYIKKEVIACLLQQSIGFSARTTALAVQSLFSIKTAVRWSTV